MKVLVVSSTPWANDNSFGNTFSNFFGDIDGLSFCNIYCKPGLPNNNLDMVCYQISEKKLVKSIFCRNFKTGGTVTTEPGTINRFNDCLVGYNSSRKLRLQIMFWIRNIIWKLGNWKTQELLQFVDDFRPDVIFQPIYYYPYLNEIALYLYDYLRIPMFGYISDDNYTLKKFSISPLYWIDRLYNRNKVKKIIEKCKILYVISDVQKDEYQRVFTTPCKVLTKSADFSKGAPTFSKTVNTEIHLVYAGNLGDGRLQSIKYLIQAVNNINRKVIRAKFDIYTPSPVPKHLVHYMSDQSISFHGAIPYNDLIAIQKKADILIHVEGLSLREQLNVHQSFSTKLVDYFALGKCIFAVGTSYQASIKHLLDNDAAIVASNKKEIYERLNWIMDNPDLLSLYGTKAYECGRKHHDSRIMKKMLCDDLSRYGDDIILRSNG